PPPPPPFPYTTLFRSPPGPLRAADPDLHARGDGPLLRLGDPRRVYERVPLPGLARHQRGGGDLRLRGPRRQPAGASPRHHGDPRSEEHTSELQSRENL